MGTLFLSKSAASAALDVSEIALLFFGVLLVVGLIGEYAESQRWKKSLKTFEMLVILGVAGELLADGGIFVFSAHLQTIADSEIAALSGAANATRERAAQLEQSNIKLQMNLEQVKRSAGQRYLSSGEQNQLVKELAAYHVNRLQIWCRLDNSEAAKFGDDLENVFTRLHWNPFRRYASESEGGVRLVGPKRIEADIAPPGLTIGVDDPKNPPKVAIALQKALRHLDFPFDARISGPWWS